MAVLLFGVDLTGHCLLAEHHVHPHYQIHDIRPSHTCHDDSYQMDCRLVHGVMLLNTSQSSSEDTGMTSDPHTQAIGALVLVHRVRI
jgi:hypothetical protein